MTSNDIRSSSLFHANARSNNFQKTIIDLDIKTEDNNCSRRSINEDNNDSIMQTNLKSNTIAIDNNEITINESSNNTEKLNSSDYKYKDKDLLLNNFDKNEFDYRNEIFSPSESSMSYSQSSINEPQTIGDASSFNYEILKEKLQLPLSEAIRPTNLEEYIGQVHLMGDEAGSIKQFFRLGYIPSMVLYGPPGVGKTTIASILAKETGYVFIELSATETTITDIRDLQNIIKKENNLREIRDEESLRIVVFIDEIHRFSKTQQDFLLPFVEAGDFVFIGATTSNPKSRIRRALLSRCQLYELTSLSSTETEKVLRRAILYENIRRRMLHNMKFLEYDSECIKHIIKKCYGDTRQAINLVELISTHYMSDSLKYNVNKEYGYRLDFEDLQDVIKILRLNESGLQNENNIQLYLDLFKYMHNHNSEFFDENGNDGIQIQHQNNRDSESELWIENKTKTNLFNDCTPEKKLVSVDRSINGKFLVKLTLEKNIIAEDRLDFKNDYPDFIEYFKTRTFEGNDTENKYLRQMQVSDDENEEEDNFEDENDSPYNMNSISVADYNVSAAIYCILKLIEAGESHMYIIKQLVLFAVLYIDSGMLEPTRTLSSMKAIKKSGTDILKVLANCVERLTKSEKIKITAYNDPIKQLRYLREFWKIQSSNNEILEKPKSNIPGFKVTFMSEAEYESMMSDDLFEGEDIKKFSNIIIQNLDKADLDEIELSVIPESLSDVDD